MSPPPEPKRFLLLHPIAQLLLCAIFGTMGEVLLKVGAAHTQNLPSPVPWLGLSGLASGWTWGSIVFTLLSLVFWMSALRTIPLGMAFPLSNSVHVFIPLSCWLFLGEVINGRRWCGIALVVAGLLIVAKTYAKIDERL